MEISEVKAALGKRVWFRDDRLFCNGVYVLTGCIIRLENGRFFYQAELQDIKQPCSVIIARLEDITLTGGKKNA